MDLQRKALSLEHRDTGALDNAAVKEDIITTNTAPARDAGRDLPGLAV